MQEKKNYFVSVKQTARAPAILPPPSGTGSVVLQGERASLRAVVINLLTAENAIKHCLMQRVCDAAVGPRPGRSRPQALVVSRNEGLLACPNHWLCSGT